MFDFIVNNFVWLMVAMAINAGAIAIMMGFFQSHPWYRKITSALFSSFLVLIVVVLASYSYVQYTVIESFRSAHELLQQNAPRH